MNRLASSHVAVFGCGGVGGYVIEALARCGIGKIDIIDSDIVELSNINRQIIATVDTVGIPKVDVTESRILSISPGTNVIKHQTFFLPENADSFDFSGFDYVVDAVDTVAAKIGIITACQEIGTPLISCMGCGNRLDPSKLSITDIYKTHTDPLAKIIRKELRKRNIPKLKVLFSSEEPITPIKVNRDDSCRRSVPGSVSFVPSAAGLIIASEMVRDLTGWPCRSTHSPT
jgi:tRNA A37 threonylcarbamoyladenosine dehydratase